MATTASGVTIPGASPTTTAATPIQDHWNNLGKSLNGRVVVPVVSVTARAALVSALTAEGYTISASNPLYTHRADAGLGYELEVTTNGTTWRTVLSTADPLAYTPAFNGFTATIVHARYWQVGKIVTAQVRANLTSAVTDTFGITVPVTARSGYPAGLLVGTAQGAHSASAVLAGVEISGIFFVVRGASTNLWAAIVPHTWVSGDWASLTATYEAA